MKNLIVEQAELYHAQKEFLSSTALRKMRISPAHCKAAIDAPPKESTAAQKRGTFYHDLCLEQNVSKYVVRPVDKDGVLVHGQTKIYKEWAASLAPGITPIRPEEHDEMMVALNAFVSNREIMDLYDGARVEHSVYGVDHETGIKIKARPDIWGKGYIADFKTYGVIDRFYEKEVFNKAYDVQLAHYAETIFAATGEVIKDFYIIAFEHEAPFASKVFEIDRDSMRVAREEWRSLMNQYKACSEDNSWPSYPQGVIEVTRPAYLETDIDVTFEGIG
jgi:hypothetical protein